MKKDELNSKLRDFAKNNISPTLEERNFVSKIYDSIKSVLNDDCIQIGSFPRYTAIRPLHDLDVLYILGKWDKDSHNPLETLTKLNEKIKKEYENPTNYEIEISLQSHSINIIFKEKDEEIFSVDIIPAYIYGKNEFDDDTYKVPEILRQKHGTKRAELYRKLHEEKKDMDWILTDPRGYIEVAKQVNNINKDFRKTVKIIKAWKNSCKTKDSNFKLKSFHIEQVITNYYQNNTSLEIADYIFVFLTNLPFIISSAQIKDRADNEKFIDEYINELTIGQKERIIEARDCILIKLEYFQDQASIDNLLDSCFYRRVCASEKFLFDYNIPVYLDDNYSFQISGYVLPREGGFLPYFLDKIGLIKIDRKIRFRIKGAVPSVDSFKWKVRNDNSSKDPRGEITDNQTKNDHERSQYSGEHYVECYAIKNNVCVARDRQNVKLERV